VLLISEKQGDSVLAGPGRPGADSAGCFPVVEMRASVPGTQHLRDYATVNGSQQLHRYSSHDETIWE
jgi:hypothetical protein